MTHVHACRRCIKLACVAHKLTRACACVAFVLVLEVEAHETCLGIVPAVSGGSGQQMACEEVHRPRVGLAVCRETRATPLACMLAQPHD